MLALVSLDRFLSGNAPNRSLNQLRVYCGDSVSVVRLDELVVLHLDFVVVIPRELCNRRMFCTAL